MSKRPMILTLLAVLFIFQTSTASAVDYKSDLTFGNAPYGESHFNLGDANSKEAWALRVFARPAGAGYFILARHARGNGTWDAVVLAVDAEGKNEKKYLIPTPMFRLDDATRDAGNGKFYFVGGAKRSGRPDSDFAVTCMDITIGTSGGPCSGFGTGGTVLTSFDLAGSKDDVARRVISRSGTGIIVAGWAKDGANRFVFAVSAYYRESGAPLTRFGIGGKFTHDVYQAGNANLDVNVHDIALSDDPAEDTVVYIAGNYSRVAAHNEYTGLVWALRGWDGTLAPFGMFGYAQIKANIGNCAIDCSEGVTALTVKKNRHIAFAGWASESGVVENATIGGLTPAGAADPRLCQGAGVCLMGPSYRNGDDFIKPHAIAELPQNRELAVLVDAAFVDLNGLYEYSETRLGRRNGKGYDYIGGTYARPATGEYSSYPAHAIWVGNTMIEVGTYAFNAAANDYRIAIRRWVDKDSIFFDQFGGQTSD